MSPASSTLDGAIKNEIMSQQELVESLTNQLL